MVDIHSKVIEVYNDNSRDNKPSLKYTYFFSEKLNLQKKQNTYSWTLQNEKYDEIIESNSFNTLEECIDNAIILGLKTNHPVGSFIGGTIQ